MHCACFSFETTNWRACWTSSLSLSLSPRMSTGDVFGATTRSNIRRSHRSSRYLSIRWFAFLLLHFFFPFSLISIREIKTIIRKMVLEAKRRNRGKNLVSIIDWFSYRGEKLYFVIFLLERLEFFLEVIRWIYNNNNNN